MESAGARTKKCRTCGDVKPIDEFDRRSDTGRLRTVCKLCRRTYQNERYRCSAPPSSRSRRLIGAAELFRCTRCGVMKSADGFPRRAAASVYLHSWCRTCFAMYKAERHQRHHDREMVRIRRNRARAAAANRARVAEHLSEHPCVDCGEDDLVVLEFDHLRDKEANVSRLVASGVSWDRVMAEIEKCQVRCANCHRRVTYRRRQEKRRINEPRGPWRLRPRRGTIPRPADSKSAALSN